MAEPNFTSLSLDDVRAIEDVITRYASGIDRRDWLLFRTCFATGFHAEYGSFGTWSDADAFTRSMQEMHAGVGATLHRLSNIVVTAAPGGASARTYVDAMLTGLDPADPVHRGVGYYDDELTRTAAGWKIARRQFTAVMIT